MTFGHTRSGIVSLVLFGLASLSASGLTAAHGAPEAGDLPEGLVKARITERPDIPGLSAMILDAPRPGIMLRYQGERPLTVMGMEGEAFLRFTRTEVQVNTHSPSWQALPNRSAQPDADIGQEPGEVTWMALSQSGSYGWLDPRLDTRKVGHGQTGGPKTWTIAIQTEQGETRRIGGELEFTPLP
ncbi:hypothetical protein QQF73_14195 [Marinobacter sp. M216]|uniref:Uncharacterized protein n=1 Tax=Marinobacter albus TaxID=3030833 RepID=A0ABT7HEI7_9GAMM|nr:MULTISPECIES: hypothetical protein [unclassified Marinobacter]MBW7472211.1 hypothetical protein [Marinobacter sp. F4218]MDK9558781.1 hypothetical protein [Marinobacter sp. M216]